jgi:uncharacterized membrane protein
MTKPSMAVLAVILMAGVGLRSASLPNEATWLDEDDVVLGGLGVSLIQPWPATFHHDEVYAPSLAKSLHLLAHSDTYPPLMYLTIYSLRWTGDVIFAARLLFLLANSVMLLLVFRVTRGTMRIRHALWVTAYVAVSPALVLVSQQIKWTAVAPALATAASCSLLKAVQSSARWMWLAYVCAMTFLLHTHYFCVWIIPAHAIFVFLWSRARLRPFLVSLAVIGTLCVPWFAIGLPRQLQYVASVLSNPSLTEPQYRIWRQPLTLHTTSAWAGYVALAVAGLQPSAFRSRYWAPLLPILIVCAIVSVLRGNRELRMLASLALLAVGCAAIGQTAYAIHLGHTVPLTWPYFVPWIPLAMVALFSGCMHMPQTAGRVVAAALVAGAAATVVMDPVPPQIRQAVSLNRYAGVARVLRSEGDAVTGIVFRRDRDAKMMNLYYSGRAPQFIWPSVAAGTPPTELRRMLVVSAVRSEPSGAPAGWSEPHILAVLGESRIEVLTRLPERARAGG